MLAPGQKNRVEVIRPFSGSPADRAGLSHGDVITRIGDMNLSGRGPNAMKNAVRNLPGGNPLPMEVTRMGNRIRLMVTLERKTMAEISALRDSQKKQANSDYKINIR